MIYLLHGENTFESWEALAQLENEILKKTKGQLTTYDCNDIAFDQITIDSYSLFNSNPVYLLKRFFSLNKNQIEQLGIALLNSDAEIIIWEDSKVDKRLGIYKSIEKKGVVREFKNLYGYQAEKWFKKLVTDKKIKIENDVLNIMLFRYGSNQSLLKNELVKIENWLKANKKNSFTKEDIAILSASPVEDIWFLVEQLFLKRKAAALKYLDQIEWEVDQMHLFIGALVSQLRELYIAKAYGTEELKSFIKDPRLITFKTKKINEYSSNFTVERLEKLYEQLLKLDYSLKRGEIEFKIGLTTLILSL